MLNRLLSLFPVLLLAFTAHAGEVVTPDGAVTLTVPDGFTTLSADEIRQKWPTSASPPSFVVGNTERSTAIAYDLKANALPPKDLDKALKAFEGVFTRIIPGIVWKRRELTEIAGRQWIQLEFTSHAVDTDIHNVMLATSFRGRMLAMNFNSTKRDFAEMERPLRDSIASLRLREP